MKRYLPIIIVVLVLFIALLAIVLAGYGDKAAATVNGERITETELDERVEQIAAMYGYDLNTAQGLVTMAFLREQILENMIEEKLILKDAEKRGIVIEQTRVDEEMGIIKQIYATDEAYQSFLAERKFTEKDLLKYIRNELVFDALFNEITKDITETTQDTKAYYDENPDEFRVKETIKARNIVLKTEEEALAVIARLDNGEDFAQLAAELSIDPTAKDNQGDIGYFNEDDNLVPEFKDAAFALEVGEYTKTPVQSTYGFHIIKVEDKKPAAMRTYEEVKEELKSRFLAEEKNERFSAYVEELKEKATIVKPPLPTEEPAEKDPPA